VAALFALGAMALTSESARVLAAFCGVGGVFALIGWRCSARSEPPAVVALPAYIAAGNVAVLHAWLRLLAGRRAPVWEPTRRGAVPSS
jgi:hypothetical protein